MSDYRLGCVGDVADHVIRAGRSYYDADLIKLIPEDVLETKLTDPNLWPISISIDERFLFPKRDEFAMRLNYEEGFIPEKESIDRLKEALNSERGKLSQELERIRREYMFLFNLSTTILHY